MPLPPLQPKAEFLPKLLYSGYNPGQKWPATPQSNGLITLLILGGAVRKCHQLATTVMQNHGLSEWAGSCGVPQRIDDSLVRRTGVSRLDGTKKLAQQEEGSVFSAQVWQMFSSVAPYLTKSGHVSGR
jgi:hypothetical protein